MTYYKEVDGASKDVVLGYVTFTNATKEVCDCINHVSLNCQNIVLCHQQKLLQWPISERIQNQRYFSQSCNKIVHKVDIILKVNFFAQLWPSRKLGDETTRVREICKPGPFVFENQKVSIGLCIN